MGMRYRFRRTLIKTLILKKWRKKLERKFNKVYDKFERINIEFKKKKKKMYDENPLRLNHESVSKKRRKKGVTKRKPTTKKKQEPTITDEMLDYWENRLFEFNQI